MRKIAPALLLVTLAACGGGENGDTTTVARTVDTSAPGTASSTDSSVAAGAKLAAVTVVVTVGVDDDPDRVEKIALGSSVTLEITNPEEDDEFHLHGYDLSTGDTGAGDTASITFTADVAGSFEVESHVTDDVLVTLVVE